MAAVRDTVEASGALKRTEVTLGLHSAEDGFFHVLSPGHHALVSGSPKRSGDVSLPIKEQGEVFHIEILVRRTGLIFLLEEGRCCVDGVEAKKGGTPTKLKVGSTLDVGGSRFTLTTRAALATPSAPRAGRRKRRSLPALPTAPPLAEDTTDQSLAETDHAMPTLLRAINSEVRRLRKTLPGQLTLEQPYAPLVTSLVSYQMLLQERTPGHAPLIGRLKEALKMVEAINPSPLREFITAFHSTLHPATPPGTTLHPATPAVNLLIQLITMTTTTKELEEEVVVVCRTLMEVLAAFGPSRNNQHALLGGGAVGCVIHCMKHSALKEEVWLIECGWGFLTDLTHLPPDEDGLALPLEQVKVLVDLMWQQLTSVKMSSLAVVRKMAAFIESLAVHSLKVHSDCNRPEVGGAALETARTLQVVLPQLKALPEAVRDDPAFNHSYLSAVHLLEPLGSSIPKKPPRQWLYERTGSGKLKRNSMPSPSSLRRAPPISGPAQSPRSRKLPTPPTHRGSKHRPVAMVTSPVPPRNSNLTSSSGNVQGRMGLSPVTPSSGDNPTPVVEVTPNGRSSSFDSRSQFSSGVGVRGVFAQQLPSLDINSLLGQHKGVGARLPAVQRNSPYYATLSLRRSGPQLAELREMMANGSSSSEDGDSPDEVPPLSVRQGGDGSDMHCPENVCPPQTVDPTHKGVGSVSKSKRTSWDPVLPSDKLFAFCDQKSVVLSEEQQVVEEIQTGHRDVMCTLRAREQLIPNVCRLWSEDKALQAVTNTLQMCLAEDEEDVALLLGVLGTFMEIQAPWRLSVCAVLLPTLQRLVLGQLDKMYVLAVCQVVEMMVDRFSPLILTYKLRPPGPRASLAATSDYETKEICFSELSKMAAVIAMQLARQQEPELQAALECLQTKLIPFSATA